MFERAHELRKHGLTMRAISAETGLHYRGAGHLAERRRQLGIHAMRQFAATLRRDLVAVRNAVSEPWSNGQTEGKSTGSKR
jgi:transposase